MSETILEKIVAVKREEIQRAKRERPASELRARLTDAPPTRDFLAALQVPGPIKLIAEVKKASPSQGLIRADFDPVEIAMTYARHGASCLSVLTDQSFFQGSLDDLTAIRSQVETPLLRKDFILDEYQLLEARAAGADAVLLIAECLTQAELSDLHEAALRLNLRPLVEFYEPENLARVLSCGATLVGVNNRDLRTFEVDLGHAVRMRARAPRDIVFVGESGISSRADVLMMEKAGIDAILVGGSLMAEADIGGAVDALLGGASRHDRGNP